MVNLFYVILFMAIVVPAVGTYLVVDEEVDFDDGVPTIQHYDTPIEPIQSEPLDEVEVEEQMLTQNSEDFDAQMRADCLAMGLDC